MNTPEQQLLDHPISDTAARLNGAVFALSAETREQCDSIAPGVLDRVSSVAELTVGLMDALDPLLAPRSALDAADREINQVLAYVEQLTSNPPIVGNIPTHLDGAVTHASQLALAIGPIPKLTDEIGKRVGRSVSRKATAIGKELEELTGRVSSLRVEIEAAHNEATSSDELRATEQQQRLAELARAIDSEKARVDNFVTTAVTENEAQEALRNERAHQAIVEQRAAFDGTLEKMRSAAGGEIASLSERSSQAISSAEKQLAELDSGLREDARDLVTHLQQRKAEVDALHQVTVQAGLSGAFATEAHQQADAANSWRRGTIVFGVLAVAIAIYVALDSPEQLNLEAVVAKLAVTLGFAALATYCARQSGQHRNREAAAKALELDLTALAPFLEQLDPSHRAKAIDLFVNRWMTSRGDQINDQLAFGAANFADAVFARFPGASQQTPSP